MTELFVRNECTALNTELNNIHVSKKYVDYLLSILFEKNSKFSESYFILGYTYKVTMINGKNTNKKKKDRKLMKKGDNRRNARYRERSKIAVEIILNNRFRMCHEREKKKKRKTYTRKKRSQKVREKKLASRDVRNRE